MTFKKSLKSVATFVFGAGLALNSMFVAPKITAEIPIAFYEKLWESYKYNPTVLHTLLLAIYIEQNPAMLDKVEQQAEQLTQYVAEFEKQESPAETEASKKKVESIREIPNRQNYPIHNIEST